MSIQTVYLVRHGETDYNVAGRWQGHLDIALNALGREQAQLVAEVFRGVAIDAVYASDLTRALHTAEAIASAAGIASVVRDERLREIHCGVFQGLTRTEITETYPLESSHVDASDAYVIPGGESRLGVQARVMDFWNDVTSTSSARTAVFVSHGGTMRWLLYGLFGKDILLGKHLYNTSVTQIERAATGWSLEKLAQITHLEGHVHMPKGRVY